MEWSERMNAAIDYIEENLAGEIDLTAAAERTACSLFYFHRVFLAVNGITPAEYTRRRRLTLAAAELTGGRGRVIDIALTYGYESPDAFARVFRNMHGVTPTAAREPGVQLMAYPRLSFHSESKGGADMDYRIIDKPAIPVAMVSRRFSNVDGQNLIDIPKWWEEFTASWDCTELTNIRGNGPGKQTGGLMLGVCYGEEETGEFHYAIAVEMEEDAGAGTFEKMMIPATTWAVFDCMLPELQDITRKVFSEWYLSTGYEHPGTPDLEVYLNEMPDEEMTCQIWAPVTRKS